MSKANSSHGESLSKKKVEQASEALKKIHDKDAQSLIKEVKDFHKKSTSLQQQGLKLAAELCRFAEKGSPNNDWAKGFAQVGEAHKELANYRDVMNKAIQDQYITFMSTQLADDTKNLKNLEGKIKTTNKEYDTQIQKLYTITQSQRKEDPQNMLKAMADLTDYVKETDTKREEMFADLQHLELDRYRTWFQLLCTMLNAELQFHSKSQQKLAELQSYWSQLSGTPLPNPPYSSWGGSPYQGSVSAPPPAAPPVKQESEPIPVPTAAKSEEAENSAATSVPPSPPNPAADSTTEAGSDGKKKGLFGKKGKEDKKEKKEEKKSKKDSEKNQDDKKSGKHKKQSKDAAASESSDASKPAAPEAPKPAASSTESSTAPSTAPSTASSSNICRVIYDYTPEQPDELKLVVGDTITILKKQEDDWWWGINQRGEKGVFPSTFVQTEAAEPKELPSDWQQVTSEDGQVYYYNQSTGETSWELPTK